MDEANNIPPDGASIAPDAPADAGATAAVKELFVVMVKTAKAMTLYMGKGASVQQFLEDLLAASDHLFEQIPVVEITIKPDAFYYQNSAMMQPEEGKQGIAYELFADGIRHLTLNRGISRDELADFVDVLRTKRGHLEESGQDLVTYMWSKEFAHVQFQAVDTFLETGAPIGEVLEQAAAAGGDIEQNAWEGSGPAPEGWETVTDIEDLVVVDADDAEILARLNPAALGQAEDRALATRTVRRDAGEGDELELQLKELYTRAKQQVVPRWAGIWSQTLVTYRRDEERKAHLLAGGCQVLLEYIRNRDLMAVRNILGSLVQASRKLEDNDQLMTSLGAALGEPETLQQVVLRMTEWDLDWVKTLAAVFRFLPTEALEVLAGGADTIAERQARLALLGFLEKSGVDVSQFRLDQLTSEDENEVLEGVKALAATPARLEEPEILELLGHPNEKVRKTLLKMLPVNRNTLAGVSRQTSRPDNPPEWIDELLSWVQKTSLPQAIPGLLAAAERLDPELHSRQIRRTFRILARYGHERVKEPFSQFLAQGSRNRAEERKLLMLAALADEGDPVWIELIKPLTKGWLKRGRVQEAATAVIKKLQGARGGGRTK